MSVSGGTALVGAPCDIDNFGTDHGAAYVFVQSSTTWTLEAELTASDGAAGDQLGSSVSVSGGIVDQLLVVHLELRRLLVGRRELGRRGRAAPPRP